jgi:hypothetical protein
MAPKAPLSMTRKCVHSRAYHKARKEALESGADDEKAKDYARLEAQKASMCPVLHFFVFLI